MARVALKDFGIRFTLDKRRDRTLKNIALNFYKREPRQEFWAVRHVDLKLKEGDILGITGPNGAGKSTLLRAITGIYGADEGSIEVEGKVSLLAIGAGFMPDLTGMENIFLNGAIFGFDEKQIGELAPKVAEFADIGEFLFQPVRTYSSGMVSRLGFAVAINLEPDILLVDEVLAVGDAAFQTKCKQAVNERFMGKGRIVVIVSHDQETINKMCNRQIQLTRPPR